MIETIEIGRGAFRAELLNFGASLRRLDVPDRVGGTANVVLGYQDLDQYRVSPRFYGAAIGRYANRIGNARFHLDGRDHQIPANDGPNSLHSGPVGFDQRIWDLVAQDAHSATFQLESPDGENGFPGNLTARLRYEMRDDGLYMAFTATSDAVTVINLTHHAYFNLAGEGAGTILDHLLQIDASRVTPTDAGQIPDGSFASVDGTPFDFRSPARIGQDIDARDPQIAIGSGYDHNFVIDSTSGTVRRMATLYDPGSGRVLELLSDAPALQFYSGNHLAGGAAGTGGSIYPARAGLCLEPQNFPDAPNQPHFPSARLAPGELYRHDLAFRFRTAADVKGAFPD